MTAKKFTSKDYEASAYARTKIKNFHEKLPSEMYTSDANSLYHEMSYKMDSTMAILIVILCMLVLMSLTKILLKLNYFLLLGVTTGVIITGIVLYYDTFKKKEYFNSLNVKYHHIITLPYPYAIDSIWRKRIDILQRIQPTYDEYLALTENTKQYVVRKGLTWEDKNISELLFRTNMTSLGLKDSHQYYDAENASLWQYKLSQNHIKKAFLIIDEIGDENLKDNYYIEALLNKELEGESIIFEPIAEFHQYVYNIITNEKFRKNELKKIGKEPHEEKKYKEMIFIVEEHMRAGTEKDEEYLYLKPIVDIQKINVTVKISQVIHQLNMHKDTFIAIANEHPHEQIQFIICQEKDHLITGYKIMSNSGPEEDFNDVQVKVLVTVTDDAKQSIEEMLQQVTLEIIMKYTNNNR